MSTIGIYFESWASKWVAKGSSMDLAQIDKRVTLVNIAFVQPTCNYVKGSMTWDGTGLNFSMDFDVVKKAISLLRARGVTVMLAVGGGSYWSQPQKFNPNNCYDLMCDLGCDGLDIDWEVGISDDDSLVTVVKAARQAIGPSYRLSFCGFSTGANTKRDGDTYSGMNLKAFNQVGNQVDWVNVMEYDAGKSFDVVDSYNNYRKVYSGPLNFGFEIGVQGWGDAILQKDEVIKNCTMVKKDGNKNGVFIWAWFSKQGPGCSVGDVIDTVSDIFKPVISIKLPVVSKPTYSCPSSVYVLCPCGKRMKTSWSQE